MIKLDDSILLQVVYNTGWNAQSNLFYKLHVLHKHRLCDTSSTFCVVVLIDKFYYISTPTKKPKNSWYSCINIWALGCDVER